MIAIQEAIYAQIDELFDEVQDLFMVWMKEIARREKDEETQQGTYEKKTLRVQA